jgi:hypothetical protein
VSLSQTQRVAVPILLGVLATAFWLERFEFGKPADQDFGPQVDTFLYFEPTARFIGTELREGRLPLWNPYQMAGQPYLGLHVPAVLYPPNLVLFGLLSPERALAAHAVFHLFLAGWLAWLFAGRIGLGTAARLVVALGFMFAGGLRPGIYVPPFLSTPVWLPAVLWALHGLATEARLRWAVALAAILAVAFLGGHAQGFVYLVQVGALYALFALGFVTPRKRRLAVLGLAVLSGLLTVGFAAPQLLPALELARDGVRGLRGVSFDQASMSPVSPRMLYEGLVHYAVTKTVFEDFRDLVSFPTLFLPLAACGWLARRQRAEWIFCLLLSVPLGLFLSGYQSAVFRFYYGLPLGNLFTGPYRLAFAYALFVSLLAGIGLEGLLAKLRPRTSRGWLPTGLAAIALLGVGVELDAQTRVIHFAHPAAFMPLPPAKPPNLVEFLRDRPGLERVFIDIYFLDMRTPYKMGMMNGLFVVPDYEPSMPGVYARAFGLDRAEIPWHGDLHAVGEYGPAAPPRAARLELLDLMSVRWYAVPQPSPPELVGELARKTSLPLVQLTDAIVGRRPQAVPRAYAVRRLRFEPDFDAALSRMLDASFEPLHEAVLTDPRRAPGSVEPGTPGGGRDEVAILSYTPAEVVIQANCREACLLVLTDLYYPGWNVRVDGSERPIECANALFRGVRLQAGSHRLVYRYAPASFRLGLVLFAIACLVPVVVTVIARRRFAHGS